MDEDFDDQINSDAGHMDICCNKCWPQSVLFCPPQVGKCGKDFDPCSVPCLPRDPCPKIAPSGRGRSSPGERLPGAQAARSFCDDCAAWLPFSAHCPRAVAIIVPTQCRIEKARCPRRGQECAILDCRRLHLPPILPKCCFNACGGGGRAGGQWLAFAAVPYLGRAGSHDSYALASRLNYCREHERASWACPLKSFSFRAPLHHPIEHHMTRGRRNRA